MNESSAPLCRASNIDINCFWASFLHSDTIWLTVSSPSPHILLFADTFCLLIILLTLLVIITIISHYYYYYYYYYHHHHHHHYFDYWLLGRGWLRSRWPLDGSSTVAQSFPKVSGVGVVWGMVSMVPRRLSVVRALVYCLQKIGDCTKRKSPYKVGKNVFVKTSNTTLLCFSVTNITVN